VWKKIHRNGESDLEDLAFLNWPPSMFEKTRAVGFRKHATFSPAGPWRRNGFAFPSLFSSLYPTIFIRLIGVQFIPGLVLVLHFKHAPFCGKINANFMYGEGNGIPG
jgi:hypothetical protein